MLREKGDDAMSATIGMEATSSLALRPSPSLVAYANLLGLPSAGLVELVERELEDNPALECSTHDRCPACGSSLIGARCLACPELRRTSSERADIGAGLDDAGRVPDRVSPRDQLVREARLLLDAADRPLVTFVAGSLDEHGLLPAGAAELARQVGCSEERMTRVVEALRLAGPPGVAALSVKECLLLQLDELEAHGQRHPLVRTVIVRHLDALARGRLDAIAKATRVTAADIAEARAFIRRHLRPYPAIDLRSTPVLPVIPTVAMLRRAGDPEAFEVEILEQRRFDLQLSPAYRAAVAEGVDPAARHVQSSVQRANRFIASLQERWGTLRTVSEYVAARQHDFLLRGLRALRPLTRAQVAVAVGLHESTVSRATAGKSVLIPSGSIVPFGSFFTASLGVRDVLRELITSETRARTDTELAAALAGRGYPIARRTVAKYREQLGILPHAQR